MHSLRARRRCAPRSAAAATTTTTVSQPGSISPRGAPEAPDNLLLPLMLELLLHLLHPRQRALDLALQHLPAALPVHLRFAAPISRPDAAGDVHWEACGLVGKRACIRAPAESQPERLLSSPAQDAR